MARLLALFLLAFVLTGCDRHAAQPPQFKGADVTGLEYARGFALTDQDGKPRTLADYRGKVVVVFFGYTQCPDVCPTTMAQLAGVMQKLGARASEVQVVFITLDPARDTQELLKQYVPAFNPAFVGLRGTPEQTDAVAKEFKVFYQKVEGTKPDNYSINHTSGIFLFDKAGKVRVIETTTDAASIEHDVRQLLG
ncbi:MAG: SCO family protein [Telluria sp.]